MLRARLTRADRWSVMVLTLVPVILNVPWALAGHPVLDGDNLTQNYPLRVLVGQLIAHGRLPLWDGAIWSGVPLLAGWNAGAMFPGTWLFAVLPPVAAYEVNVVGAGILAGVGLHLFLRRSGCSPLASVLGALTFSETGFLSGQVVHLGLVEGTALAPWILLAIDGMFRAHKAGASSGYWTALLGAAGGLVVLAGDPRAVSSDAIIAAIYLAARCWGARRQAIRVLRSVAAGAILAVSIAAVQWLPGLVYLQSSQRSASTLALFGFYSLGWNNLPLLFTPYLIGGNGNFAMPVYAGQLNLPEVTYAVGILPLIALFALAPRAIRDLRRRREQEPPASETPASETPASETPASEAGAPEAGSLRLTVWYVMFIVGLVLTTGSKTPLGHVLVHIPLYGGQRDQNRNAAIADFALAGLLGFFVDSLRVDAATTRGRLASWRERFERYVGLFPVAVVLGLVAAMLAWTRPVEHWLGVTGTHPGLGVDMAGYYAAAVVIALGGGVVLVRTAWRSTESRRRAAAGVVLADVLLFVAMASYQPIPLSALAPANPALSALLTHLPTGTRFAIDDPDQLALTDPPLLTDELGVNDLVLLHDVESVQGYGSAVPAAYEAATGTHDVEDLLPEAFLGTTYDDLDLGLVAVVPEQFGQILPLGTPILIPPGPPVPTGTSAADTQPGERARAPYPPSGPWRLAAGGVAWQLPAPTVISSVTVDFDGRYGPVPTTPISVSVRLADGHNLVVPATVSGTNATTSLPLAVVKAGGGALAISVSAPGPSASEPVVGAVVVAAEAASAPLALHQPASGTVRFVLDGFVQGLLTPPHWVYVGHVGPLVLYRNTRVRGPAWLEAAGARSSSMPSAAGSVQSPSLPPWQDPVTIVDAPHAALLVRSEQYSPGWSATVQPVTGSGSLGPPSILPVRPIGLLQGVVIPAGRSRVTWHYHSGRAELGLGLAAAGCVACASFGLLGLRSRRRRLALTT